MISTAAFHARVRGSVPGLGGLKETKMFLPHPRVKVSIVGSPRDRELACSASDRLGSNFESCVWRTVSSQSSHHPQEVLLAQFSLYVHKGGLMPDSFHFIYAKNFLLIFYNLECNIPVTWADFLINLYIQVKLGWGTSWWCRDEADDTALQIQYSKVGLWRYQAANATSWLQGLPTIRNLSNKLQ